VTLLVENHQRRYSNRIPAWQISTPSGNNKTKSVGPRPPGAWQSVWLFTNSRNGLTPGTAYTIEAHAIGGAAGYSDWSNDKHRRGATS
jgi:hypothetical protein